MRRGAPGAAGISRPSHGVLAHAWAMLTGPPGTIGHIDADLNNPSALTALSWLAEGACQVAGELQLPGHE